MNPVWLPAEAEKFCALMRKSGLEISSCHIFGDPLQNFDAINALISV
jgi:hypothetical protein